MLRSAILKSLLVFALLLTQQGGLTHAVAHTLAEQSQDQQQPHDQQCELCAVYAQVGSALGSGAIQFDFATPLTEQLAVHSVSFRSAAFTAFAARAPPFPA